MVEPEGRKNPMDAAVAWLVRLRDGPTDAEWNAHVRWLEVDPAHEAAMSAAELAWVDSDGITGMEGDGVADLIVGPERDQANVVPMPTRPVAWRRGSLWAGGAIAAVLAGVVVLPSLMTPDAPPQTFRSGPGERRMLGLPDGSRITLNRSTEVAIGFRRDARTVEMRTGEAAFDVRRDPARPFVVDLGTRHVRVLGTEFNVARRGTGFSVAVRRGLVEVRAIGQQSVTVRLPPGTALVQEAGASRAMVERTDVEAAFAWTEGQLAYTDQPLSKVAADLERYTGRRVVVDPALAGLRVTATVRIADGGSLERQLETLLPIRLKKRAGETVIEPAR